MSIVPYVALPLPLHACCRAWQKCIPKQFKTLDPNIATNMMNHQTKQQNSLLGIDNLKSIPDLN